MQKAFTLIELLVVITIISILASMTIVGYNIIQRDTRDSARSAKTTIIAEALEKYYDKNNQYPPMATLAPPATVASVQTLLNIKDSDALVFPGTPTGTLAIATTGSPSASKLIYTGSNLEPSENGQCFSSVNGYCDSFTLQYISEAGQTITVKSRHNPTP